MNSRESHVSASPLYDRDYCIWLQRTIESLRLGKFGEIDIQNLVEELEDMGRSQKDAVESNLQIVLMHLLKYRYQPRKRSNSWRYTILEHRDRLERAFQHSPSLENYFDEVFADCYRKARRKASAETGLSISTFPDECPFSKEEVLNSDFLPE